MYLLQEIIYKMKMNSKVYLWNASPKILAILMTNRDLFKFKIAKLVNCTTPHANKILKEFNKIDLTIEKKVGRRVYVELTKKGKQVADNLLKII